MTRKRYIYLKYRINLFFLLLLKTSGKPNIKFSIDFIFAILCYSHRVFLKGQVMKEMKKRMTVKRVIEYPHMDRYINYKLAKRGEILDMKNGV